MSVQPENLNEIIDLLKQEAEAVKNIPVSDSYLKAVDLIYQKVHKEGGKVIASGMGKAGQIAENIATTLSSTGTPAVFLHPSEAQHGDLGVIRENDCFLFCPIRVKHAKYLNWFNLRTIFTQRFLL